MCFQWIFPFIGNTCTLPTLKANRFYFANTAIANQLFSPSLLVGLRCGPEESLSCRGPALPALAPSPHHNWVPNTDAPWKSHTVEAQTSVSRVHRVASVSTQLRPPFGTPGAEQGPSCFKRGKIHTRAYTRARTHAHRS